MTADRPFYIYCHTAPNGKRYIGQTCQGPEGRWRGGYGYKGCVHFERAIAKYGWDNFDHQILCVVHSVDAANAFERHYISKYDTFNSDHGYNLTSGGSSGYVFDDATREKLRELGRKRGISPELNRKMKEGRSRNGWRRRPMTEEERKAVSERLRGPNHPFYGKKLPKEWVEKRAAKIRGRKASEEAKRNQSIGLRNSEKVKAKQKAVLQLDLDGNLIKRHDGLSAAARELGVSKQGIRHACAGVTDTAYGFRWEYDDDELREQARLTREKGTDTSTIGLPVIQYDLDGNEIARFKSTVDASHKTGFPRYSITNCCRGRIRTSRGYIWRYQQDAA